MKIVIAAAGKGTRMKHLTKNKPKPLIKIHKKPFLAYLLGNILKAGYKEIILVVGYKEEKVRDFLKKYRYKVKLVNQYKILGENEYGTLSALKCLKKFLASENFVMVYGDNLYSPKDLKSFKINDNYHYVAGFWHPHPEKYGVIVSDNKGFLKKIVEKPKKFVGNLINTGLYKFSPEIFKKISKVSLSIRGEYELTDAINLLAKEKKVKVKEIQDYWFDFGNPADIIKLSRFLKVKN